MHKETQMLSKCYYIGHPTTDVLVAGNCLFHLLLRF